VHSETELRAIFDFGGRPRGNVYRGRTPAVSPANAADLRLLAAEGVPKTVLAAGFSVSRETVYAYLRLGPDTIESGDVASPRTRSFNS
jgi:DNA invertase Pin-like site-specific DNA recombinase